MLERFERPLKFVCLAMAALLVWELTGLIQRGDPLAHLKIPALPALPGATNEPAKLAGKETNAELADKTGTNATHGTNGTNAMIAANGIAGTNVAARTNVIKATNVSSESKRADSKKSGPSDKLPGSPRGMLANLSPEMMGGRATGRGGMKPIELPPDVKARVERIIDSEILGPVVRPMPMALIGIADEEAFIQATNGQTGPVKVGGEIGGIGGESLLPKSADTSSTNAPAKQPSTRDAVANNAPTNQILSPKQKETQ